MISKLRELFTEDPENTYYITGAPQCPIPEPNSKPFWYLHSLSGFETILDLAHALPM